MPVDRDGPDGEERFLERYDPRSFPPMAVAVDVALITAEGGSLHALMRRRSVHPARHRWSLLGGFVGPHEPLEQTARRVLRERAGLDGVFLEQLYTFGDPARDPRMRVVAVAYYALVDPSRFARRRAREDTVAFRIEVPWEGETGGEIGLFAPGEAQDRSVPVAFDHALILGTVVQRMRGKLSYAPIGFQLLPESFTLRQLQRVHETVLGRSLNKDSFRRRMLSTGELRATGERQTDVGHRPAELYRFSRASAV